MSYTGTKPKFLAISFITGGIAKFWNAANTFYIGIKAGTVTANKEFILPNGDGTANQALTTDGSLQLGWSSVLTNPMGAVGDTVYGGTAGVDTNFSVNITTTREFLQETGTGAVGQAPSWVQPVSSDILGRTDGEAPSSGGIGQQISSVIADNTNFPGASGAWGDATSIALTAGIWDVSIFIVGKVGTTATFTTFAFGIGTASGSSSTGLVIGDTQANTTPPSAATAVASAIPAYRVAIASPATYYFKLIGVFTGGTPVFGGRISAVRVA
jgi:hypothetical protein